MFMWHSKGSSSKVYYRISFIKITLSKLLILQIENVIQNISFKTFKNDHHGLSSIKAYITLRPLESVS